MSDKYAVNLYRQLQMAPHTWRRLTEFGVDENTELALNYIFNAPDKDKAAKLVGMLHQYGYRADVRQTGTFFNKKWIVEGWTNPGTFSPEKLDQWVQWMVQAGKECESHFDSWDAEVMQEAA